MSYEFLHPFSLLLFATTVFSVTLAIYVTSSRRDTVSKGLAGILVGARLWALADGLRIASPTVSAVLFWNKVTYVGAGIIVPSTVSTGHGAPSRTTVRNSVSTELSTKSTVTPTSCWNCSRTCSGTQSNTTTER
jgi:hypothetical protein